MKTSKLFLMSAAVVLFAAGACNKETDDSGNGGGTDGGATATPEIVVDSDEVSVSYEGGEVAVGYSVTNAVEGESLTANVDTDWVSAVVGDETVTLTVGANEDAESRSATVTLSYPEASDVVISVVQEAWTVSYESFIGTWTVTGSDDTSATITISQNVEGESYTVSGWQFDGEYSDIYDLGFNESGSLDFTATYDADNQTVVFETYDFGEFTTYYSGIGTLTGNFWVMGTYTYSSSSSGFQIVNPATYGAYEIATMSMTDANNFEITGSSVSTYSITGMRYIYYISSPTAYSGYYLYFNTDLGTSLPATGTKVAETASASSVKSSEKPVMMMGM